MGNFYSKKNRGMSTIAAIAVAAFAAFGTIGGSFVAASIGSASKVAVLEERENNHYLEVKGILERMEGTLNQIATPTLIIEKQ